MRSANRSLYFDALPRGDGFWAGVARALDISSVLRREHNRFSPLDAQAATYLNWLEVNREVQRAMQHFGVRSC
jgi:hypothetical protein